MSGNQIWPGQPALSLNIYMAYFVARPAAAALLLAFHVSVASAQLTFNITNQGTATAQMVAGFNQAAALWSARLSDPITINIRISASALSAGVIGHSEIYYDPYVYTNV